MWFLKTKIFLCFSLNLIPTPYSPSLFLTIRHYSMICSEQLYSWLTVQAFLFLSQIVSTCNILQRQTMMISSSRANAMDQRTRIMLLVFMIWTVIGVGFLGSDHGNAQDPCVSFFRYACFFSLWGTRGKAGKERMFLRSRKLTRAVSFMYGSSQRRMTRSTA